MFTLACSSMNITMPTLATSSLISLGAVEYLPDLTFHMILCQKYSVDTDRYRCFSFGQMGFNALQQRRIWEVCYLRYTAWMVGPVCESTTGGIETRRRWWTIAAPGRLQVFGSRRFERMEICRVNIECLYVKVVASVSV